MNDVKKHNMGASTNTKTLTQILQALISMHTAKKEAVGQGEHAQQSETFIKELLNELSLSGDGVSSEVEHSPAENHDLSGIDAALRKAYEEALSSGNLPASVETLFRKQLSVLT